MTEPVLSIEERLEKYIAIDLETGCWNYIGCLNEHGYGIFGILNKTYLAHRVSWKLYVGEIPKGLHVLHHCDNPRCINPEHLFLGTPKDNALDKVSKDRQTKGEVNGGAKLTDEQAAEIRFLAALGVETQEKLARRFGVSQPTVSFILSGKTWRHV